jgi:hypothetical protein
VKNKEKIQEKDEEKIKEKHPVNDLNEMVKLFHKFSCFCFSTVLTGYKCVFFIQTERQGQGRER